MKIEDKCDIKSTTDVPHKDSTISAIINSLDELQEQIPSPEIIQISQERLHLLKGLKETLQPLLDDPVTELTREKQKLLLVTSALCLIITQGVVTLTSLEIEGAKFDMDSSWGLTLAITLATLYYLIIFVISFWRDMSVQEVMINIPLREAKILFEQHSRQFADNLQPHKREYYKSILKLGDDLRSLLSLNASGKNASGKLSEGLKPHLSEIAKPFFEKSNNLTSTLNHKLETNKSFIDLFNKITKINNFALWVELLLPTSIAFISLFLGIKQITGF